jgi:hypothetical protein
MFDVVSTMSRPTEPAWFPMTVTPWLVNELPELDVIQSVAPGDAASGRLMSTAGLAGSTEVLLTVIGFDISNATSPLLTST